MVFPSENVGAASIALLAAELLFVERRAVAVTAGAAPRKWRVGDNCLGSMPVGPAGDAPMPMLMLMRMLPGSAGIAPGVGDIFGGSGDIRRSGLRHELPVGIVVVSLEGATVEADNNPS